MTVVQAGRPVFDPYQLRRAGYLPDNFTALVRFAIHLEWLPILWLAHIVGISFDL